MKLRSHSGLKKRIRKQKRKLMIKKPSKNHLLVNKARRQKRAGKKPMALDVHYIEKAKKLLPYL